ncbi:hypothetical protein QJS10_CPB04g00837 [Acorus calamus]|uniref:F-box domain-containing protein n=1 Tax=Acorus calamus TaxID=4465 RepID=A0AAV9F0G5_ACOCL|nr:hypothetical protein QJS10_CPB04g00837 [Acorus calamus]
MWSNLPKDLIELILHHLDLGDHIRFSVVCTTWRFAFTKENSPVLKSLWLAYSADPEKAIIRLLGPFFDELQGDDRHVGLRYGRGYFGYDGRRCIGSFMGWLFVVDQSIECVSLVNPFTGAMISLPPHDEEPYSYYDPYFFTKVVTSNVPCSDDCIAMGLTQDGCLGICRPKYEVWTLIDRCINYSDIIFHKGLFFGLNSGRPMSIVVFNVFTFTGSGGTTRASVGDLRLDVPEVRSGGEYYKLYLVESSSGKLLLVVRNYHSSNKEWARICQYWNEIRFPMNADYRNTAGLLTVGFSVYEVDIKVDINVLYHGLVLVESLGD